MVFPVKGGLNGLFCRCGCVFHGTATAVFLVMVVRMVVSLGLGIRLHLDSGLFGFVTVLDMKNLVQLRRFGTALTRLPPIQKNSGCDMGHLFPVIALIAGAMLPTAVIPSPLAPPLQNDRLNMLMSVPPELTWVSALAQLLLTLMDCLLACRATYVVLFPLLLLLPVVASVLSVLVLL